MCGLVGIAGDLQLRDESTMKRLFLADFFRGPDSTGLASIRKSGIINIAKIASNPIDLFGMTRFNAALSGNMCKAFIGHNRAATRGAVSNVNAHPFQYGHIVGAHNGTLEPSSFCALEDAIGETFEVDSMAIFAAIAKIGLEETVKLLEGAWALVFYDSNEDTLNFLRNDKRPFWYSFTSDFKKIIWASEYPMIETATKMAGKGEYELHKEGKENYCYFSTEVDVHYKFEMDKLIAGGTSRPKAKAKTLKGKEPAPVISKSNDPFGRDGVNGGTRMTNLVSTAHSTQTGTGGSGTRNRRNPQRIKHFVGTATKPLAGFLTWSELEAKTKCSCSYCHQPVLLTARPSFTYYERDNVLLCRECGPSEENTIRIYPKVFDFEELTQ